MYEEKNTKDLIAFHAQVYSEANEDNDKRLKVIFTVKEEGYSNVWYYAIITDNLIASNVEFKRVKSYSVEEWYPHMNRWTFDEFNSSLDTYKRSMLGHLISVGSHFKEGCSLSDYASNLALDIENLFFENYSNVDDL